MSPHRPGRLKQLTGFSFALTLIQNILKDSPGLFAVTGQPGTGKTTTLIAIAKEAAELGRPIVFVTDDKKFSSKIELPDDWNFQVVDVSDNHQSLEEAWSEKLNQVPLSSAIIVDLLTGDNDSAVLAALKRGYWVFTCIDTPLVGIDITYNLQGTGWTNQDILSNLKGIVSQLLLPCLCSNCAQTFTANLEETRLIYPDAQQPKKLHREVGCQRCDDSGTKGRCAAYEVLWIDDQVRPLLTEYLEHTTLHRPPAAKYFSMNDCVRNLVESGLVGIGTFKRKVFQNPLLRLQHLWEQESFRSAQIQGMFSRFVTQQVVERIVSREDFEKIVEGEKRYVTCLFCDIRNFTTRSERFSPKDLFLEVNEYFREIIDLIFQQEGTIDKFIGDAIMVVFGAPINQTDQELRAVQCAIDIQHKVAQMNQLSNSTDPIQVGIGINTGEVMAGCIGSDRRMDYTVLGDVVNVAARLESQAKPGQILIGSTTFRAVQQQIQCQAVGSLQLKGKSEAIETFAIVL